MSAASAARWPVLCVTCPRKARASFYSDTITLPDTLELYIPQRDQTLAPVAWRKNDEIGAAFVPP